MLLMFKKHLSQNSNYKIQQSINFCVVCLKESSGARQCVVCGCHIHTICEINSEENEGYGALILCPLCGINKNVTKGWKEAKDNLTQQEKRMKKLYDDNFSPV